MDPKSQMSAGRTQRLPEVVKSAVRALEILEFFDRTQGAVSVGCIAADLGYPQSSTSALLRSLVKVGYLIYDAEQRTFEPTRRVAMLGSWLGEPFYCDGPVLTTAKRIAERSGSAVGIGRRNGRNVQWLHAISSDTISKSDVFASDSSLTRSAPGLCLLASLGDREIHGIVHRANSETDDLEQIIKQSDITQRVAEIRRDGYVVTRDENASMMAMLFPMPGRDAIVLSLIDSPCIVEERIPQVVAMLRECMCGMQDRSSSETIPIAKVPWAKSYAAPESWGLARQAAHV